MKYFLLILFSILFCISCGKKDQKLQTKISFFSGSQAMLAGGTQMNGGIIVVGHRLDDSEHFQIGLINASDEKFVDLSKGLWEFAAIGWEGSVDGMFTGNNRCAYSGIIDLNMNDTLVAFNLDYATCSNLPGHGAIISPPEFLYNSSGSITDQFKPIKIKSCGSLTGNCALTGTAVSPSEYGITGSVKIGAIGEMKIGTAINLLPSLVSGCISLTSNKIATTQITLPVGNYINGKYENLMETTVAAYSTTDCTGASVKYRFKDTLLKGLSTTNAGAIVATSAGTNVTELTIEHNASTVINIGAAVLP
jgi:hypothetical protein